MTEMSKAQIGRFLMQGTFTGKLATVKKDGSSHVVPIWFVLDKSNSKGKVGDIIFTTGDTSVKANNIQRDAEKSPLVVISGAPGIKERRKNPLLHHKVRDFDTQQKIFEHMTIDSVLIDNPRSSCQRY